MSGIERESLVLGLDLGGTKIAAALATPEGEIMARGQSPTLAENGRDAVIEAMFATVESTLAAAQVLSSQLLGIGIAAAGLIDAAAGKLVFSPNLPGWRDVPLRDAVRDRFLVRTCMGNDATLAALGEWTFGLKREVANLVYITVSTGIGAGIIADGRLYGGTGGAAGEVGHMTIDVNGPRCGCGNRGCWETLASGTALAREAAERVREGARTLITELAGERNGGIDARVVFEAAEAGDELARELISRQGYYLGVGLANLVNIFSPELVLVGGGVAKMGDLLFQPATEVVRERAYSTRVNRAEIRPALLGDDSGVLGAVAYVLDELAAEKQATEE